MTAFPPASREEIVAMLGDVDSSYVDRVLDTGASVDEIGEAADDLVGAEFRNLPSSTRVAEVRKILAELVGPDAETPHTFPIKGVPLGHF